MLNLLVISQPPYRKGGVSSQLRWLCSALTETGHYHPTVLCIGSFLPEGVNWDSGTLVCSSPELRKFNVHGIDTLMNLCRLPTLGGRVKRLRDSFMAVHSSFDGVQVVSGGNLEGLGPAEAGRDFLLWIATTMDSEFNSLVLREGTLKQKVIRLLYMAERERLRRWENFVFAKARSVLAISPFTMNLVIQSYPFLNGRCKWVPIPVSTADKDPASIRPKVGRVIFAGAVNSARKGLAALMRAIALAREELPHIKLVVIGGTIGFRLRRLATNLNICDCMENPGRIPNTSIEFAQADVMVIPSLQEGLNIAGLEAMAHGVPVISTRCGGPECYVIENETGLLTPINDPRAMSKSIIRIVKDRVLRERLGKAARLVVQDVYAPERIVKMFIREHERVLGLPLRRSFAGAGRPL